LHRKNLIIRDMSPLTTRSSTKPSFRRRCVATLLINLTKTMSNWSIISLIRMLLVRRIGNCMNSRFTSNRKWSKDKQESKLKLTHYL
jgi:hypothetical protein